VYVDRKTGERLDVGARLGLSLGMVTLNQGLVQFADQKANGLVVVSSIFLASLAPSLDHLDAAEHPHLRDLGLAACAAAILALLAALRVMLARNAAASPHAPQVGRSLVFFKHVSAIPKAADYIETFREADGERVLDSLLASNHDVCAIANMKFKAYRWAERLTLLAAVLWGAAILAAAQG
jgi:hypothetical protein